MPAESPVGLSSVLARMNICEPRTTASRGPLYDSLNQNPAEKTKTEKLRVL